MSRAIARVLLPVPPEARAQDGLYFLLARVPVTATAPNLRERKSLAPADSSRTSSEEPCRVPQASVIGEPVEPAPDADDPLPVASRFQV